LAILIVIGLFLVSCALLVVATALGLKLARCQTETKASGRQVTYDGKTVYEGFATPK
jgi:hypothetical protein